MEMFLYLAIAFVSGFIASTVLEARRRERREANLEYWTEWTKKSS